MAVRKNGYRACFRNRFGRVIKLWRVQGWYRPLSWPVCILAPAAGTDDLLQSTGISREGAAKPRSFGLISAPIHSRADDRQQKEPRIRLVEYFVLMKEASQLIDLCS